VYIRPKGSVTAHVVSKYELAYQPTSPTERKSAAIFGIAVATIVLSKEVQKTQQLRPMMTAINLRPTKIVPLSSQTEGMREFDLVLFLVCSEMSSLLELAAGETIVK
jgi:hypothetical protein